jgi:hypothetical protein
VATAVDEDDGVPAQLVTRIDETVKEYSRQFDALMQTLKEEGEKAGDILRFLTFRLDFNNHHQQQRAQGSGVGLTATPPVHLKTAFSFGNSASMSVAGAGAGAGAVDRIASANSMSPMRSASPLMPADGRTDGRTAAPNPRRSSGRP